MYRATSVVAEDPATNPAQSGHSRTTKAVSHATGGGMAEDSIAIHEKSLVIRKKLDSKDQNLATRPNIDSSTLWGMRPLLYNFKKLVCTDPVGGVIGVIRTIGSTLSAAGNFVRGTKAGPRSAEDVADVEGGLPEGKAALLMKGAIATAAQSTPAVHAGLEAIQQDLRTQQISHFGALLQMIEDHQDPEASRNRMYHCREILVGCIKQMSPSGQDNESSPGSLKVMAKSEEAIHALSKCQLDALSERLADARLQTKLHALLVSEPVDDQATTTHVDMVCTIGMVSAGFAERGKFLKEAIKKLGVSSLSIITECERNRRANESPDGASMQDYRDEQALADLEKIVATYCMHRLEKPFFAAGLDIIMTSLAFYCYHKAEEATCAGEPLTADKQIEEDRHLESVFTLIWHSSSLMNSIDAIYGNSHAAQGDKTGLLHKAKHFLQRFPFLINGGLQAMALTAYASSLLSEFTASSNPMGLGADGQGFNASTHDLSVADTQQNPMLYAICMNAPRVCSAVLLTLSVTATMTRKLLVNTRTMRDVVSLPAYPLALATVVTEPHQWHPGLQPSAQAMLRILHSTAHKISADNTKGSSRITLTTGFLVANAALKVIKRLAVSVVGDLNVLPPQSPSTAALEIGIDVLSLMLVGGSSILESNNDATMITEVNQVTKLLEERTSKFIALLDEQDQPQDIIAMAHSITESDAQEADRRNGENLNCLQRLVRSFADSDGAGCAIGFSILWSVVLPVNIMIAAITSAIAVEQGGIAGARSGDPLLNDGLDVERALFANNATSVASLTSVLLHTSLNGRANQLLNPLGEDGRMAILSTTMHVMTVGLLGIQGLNMIINMARTYIRERMDHNTPLSANTPQKSAQGSSSLQNLTSLWTVAAILNGRSASGVMMNRSAAIGAETVTSVHSPERQTNAVEVSRCIYQGAVNAAGSCLEAMATGVFLKNFILLYEGAIGGDTITRDVAEARAMKLQCYFHESLLGVIAKADNAQVASKGNRLEEQEITDMLLKKIAGDENTLYEFHQGHEEVKLMLAQALTSCYKIVLCAANAEEHTPDPSLQFQDNQRQLAYVATPIGDENLEQDSRTIRAVLKDSSESRVSLGAGPIPREPNVFLTSAPALPSVESCATGPGGAALAPQ